MRGPSLISALSSGLRLVLSAPLVLLGLWGVNVAVALPGAWWMFQSLERSIGHSRAHEELVAGWSSGWFREYAAAARGAETTFSPDLIGAGAFYDNLEAWLTGGLFEISPLLIAAGVAYGLLWMALLGGVIDRYAHPQERSLRRFRSQSRSHFPRFVRLTLLTALPYFLVYRVALFLFERVDENLRDVTVEGTVLLYATLIWGMTALSLTLIHVCADYARIVAVVEQRRSMVLSLLRGAGFVLRHPLRTLGLYYGLLLVAGLWLVMFSLVGPGAGPSSRAALIGAFAVSQLFLIVRLAIRLTMLAGGTTLYRSLAAVPGSDERETA